jgi:hypothetical protein
MTYFIRADCLRTRSVTYREYASRATAERAFRRLVADAEATGQAVTYSLVALDAAGQETCLGVY